MKITKAAFPNSTLTPETAAVYLSEWALIVNDIGQDAFELALTAAMRASKFFPTIAEIREHAGLNVTTEKKLKIQAEQAWEWVQTFIRKWHGVPGGRVLKGRNPESGELIWETPPAIPGRIDYAVRAVGGIRAIANVDDHSLPFMKKEFVEAFDNAQFAASFAMELPAHEVLKQLGTGLPQVKRLSEASPKQVRQMARVMTDEEEDARRLELKRQAVQAAQLLGGNPASV